MKFVCNAKKVRLFHCKSKVFVFFRVLEALKTHENVIVTVSTTYLFSMFFQNNKIPFKNVNKTLIFFEKHVKVVFFMFQNKLRCFNISIFPLFFTCIFTFVVFFNLAILLWLRARKSLNTHVFLQKTAPKSGKGGLQLYSGSPSGLTI